MVGADLNLYARKKRIHDDILFIGLRYGYSNFNHNIDASNYTGNLIESGTENLSAHWAEFVTGGKAELWFLKNVFVGLTLRTRFMINKDNASAIEPSRIPGFGNNAGGSVGLNWSISYRFPLKKIKVVEEKKDNKKKNRKENGK